MALCMVYREPYRGLGSDVPSRGRPRRASASASRAGKRKAGAVGHPEAPTRARRRRRQLHGRIEDDDDAMSFAQMLESELLSYFETTENSPRVEPAAPEYQGKPNCAMRQQAPASNDDDDEVMEISLDEFFGSSAAHPVPPRAAQLESASAAAADDDVLDMCGLACPPMDDAYVELILSGPLVQFDPAFIEEFISDP